MPCIYLPLVARQRYGVTRSRWKKCLLSPSFCGSPLSTPKHALEIGSHHLTSTFALRILLKAPSGFPGVVSVFCSSPATPQKPDANAPVSMTHTQHYMISYHRNERGNNTRHLWRTVRQIYDLSNHPPTTTLNNKGRGETSSYCFNPVRARLVLDSGTTTYHTCTGKLNV